LRCSVKIWGKRTVIFILIVFFTVPLFIFREKIAQLPPEIADFKHLSTLSSEEEAVKLLHRVKAASQLLEVGCGPCRGSK
jgi:hypothetical protein